MGNLFRQALTHLGVFMSHPAAFVIVVAYGTLWVVFDRESFNWHGVTALATLFMTLIIQRAEHRDTQAIHAKLDELLRVESRARDELTRVDEQEPEDIEQHREEEKNENKDNSRSKS